MSALLFDSHAVNIVNGKSDVKIRWLLSESKFESGVNEVY